MGLQFKKAARALLVGCLLVAMVIGVFPIQAPEAKAASVLTY